MQKYARIIINILNFISTPIRNNIFFAVSIVCLGILSSLQFFTYRYAFPEILFDVYILTCIISIFPQKTKHIVTWIVASILYFIAIVDNYCFVKFGMPIRDTSFILLAETNKQEVSDFFQTFFSFKIIFSRLGLIFFLLCIHIIFCSVGKCYVTYTINKISNIRPLKNLMPVITLGIIVFTGIYLPNILTNHARAISLLNTRTLEQFDKRHSVNPNFEAFLPIYRLVIGLKSFNLSKSMVSELRQNNGKFNIEGCDNKSGNIVLIIGESSNCTHSELYGYNKNTTPWQSLMFSKHKLTMFDNAVTPWNLTHYVLKYIFSTASIDSKYGWSTFPLFPTLFRKAGYNVTFLTNQYVQDASNFDFDVTAGSFLTDNELSKAQFDYRNTRTYNYDMDFINAYKDIVSSRISSENSKNLFIFHLKGLHFHFYERFTKDYEKWKYSDYPSYSKLNTEEKKTLSQYDNAMLYNDAVLKNIVDIFSDKNAIIIYLSDHGEEVFPNGTKICERNLSDCISSSNAQEEYKIPFWIYTTSKYEEQNPDVVRRIKESCNLPFMSDDIPHLLLYLAGIKTKWYNPTKNLISPSYKKDRKRMLRNLVDYDKLIQQK